MRTFLVLCKKRKFSPMPPPPSTQRNKEEILFRCENFLCYARNENISPRPPPLGENFRFLHNTRNFCIYREFLPLILPESSKKFSLDTKKSCFMQETKNFRQHPPPFLIVISYFFIDTSTIELNCHNQARNSH